MLVEKAIGRYGDIIRNLLPLEPREQNLDKLMLSLIREIDQYQLALKGNDGELLERVGESYHVEGNLRLAGNYYHQAITALPLDSIITNEMRAAVMRYAPLLHLTENEFFPLRDVVAIHHPEKPMIAYHLFWEDDYDFPDDYEPCDHEQVWMAYDPITEKVTGVWAFYHGSVITTSRAVESANEGNRPSFRVQWGKHGSIPEDGERVQLPYGTVLEDMRRTYEEVYAGGRMKDHPIKRKSWPEKYQGSWQDFMSFPVTIDSRLMLADKDYIFCSELSNAIIQQYCLTYNFAAKYGWPWHAPIYNEAGWLKEAGEF